MDGVILTPLKRITHPKGDIFHAMKAGDKGFYGFGEAYFSTINKGDTKGWKRHVQMTLNLVVVKGEIEFVVFDEKKKDFLDVILSKNNYQRLTIDPGLWLAFRGVESDNVLLNIANIKHTPKESVTVPIEQISYEWKR